MKNDGGGGGGGRERERERSWERRLGGGRGHKNAVTF
jgi:hypothetical protein